MGETNMPSRRSRLRALGIASGLVSVGLLSHARSAFALDWPVGNGTTNQPIFSTVGQYYEGTGGGLHFHEGVDIAVAGGTVVRAREAGTVMAINNDAATPANSYLTFRTGAAGTVGQNYVHMVPGNRPAGNNGAGDPGGPWAVGDTIKVGDQLGTVGAQAGGFYPDHLHMDRGTGQDNYLAPAFLNLPNQNVLAQYVPNVSAGDPTPVLSTDFHFLRADNDRLGTAPGGGAIAAQLGQEQERTDNQYFDTDLAGLRRIGRLADTHDSTAAKGAGSGNIDILASAYDEAGPATKYHNGIYSMAFKIRGNAFNDGTADDGTGNGPNDLRELYKFDGAWLDDGTATKHQYTALRTSNLVRVVYGNDVTSNSSDDASGNAGNYWYIVTNNSGDQIVDANDRARYWNSDVAKGKSWNDIASADGANNARCAFRDDIYSINVIARDVRGGIASSVRDVILDNWLQKITLGGNSFEPNEDIYLSSAEQFSGNDSNVPLILLSAAPTENQLLPSSFSFFGTDADGMLADPELLGPGSMFGPGSYWMVADYNHDGRYISALDAFAQFTVIPEPASLALLAMGSMLQVDRSRKRSIGRL
jgi:hypothetical protein